MKNNVFSFKIIGLVALVVAVILILITNTNAPAVVQHTEAFKIGASLPLTGDYSAYGEEFKRGAELAVKEINSTNPNSIELIIEDTAGDSKKALFGVKKLIEVDKIDASVIASYNEVAASWQVLKGAKIPTVVLWDSNPAIEAMGDFVFAIGPWTPASGEVPAKYLFDKGARKTAILSFNQEWGVSVSNAFAEKFTTLGGTITAKEFPAPGTKDFRSIISKILKDNPDVIYFPTDSVYQIVKQVRSAGFKGILVTSDVLDAEVVRQDPTLFEGVYTSQVADPTSAETATYLKAYKAEYGFDAKKIVIGAWGYDGIMALYKAQKIRARYEALRDNLYKTDFAGASAHMQFNAEGSSKVFNKMFVVKNAEIVPVE